MKRLFALLLALSLLLCACGVNGADTTASSQSTTESSTSQTTQDTTLQTTTGDTTVPGTTTKAQVLYRNPLSGEPMEDPYTGRPFAVVCNNIRYAMPQHGISEAEFLFEILAEGGITRCVAVFSDVASVSRIGSIRSARTYLVSLARSFDAVFVHCGDSTYAADLMSSVGMAHLDGMYLPGFYRDQDRLNSGYDLEHTLFIHGEDVPELAAQQGYTTEYDSPVSFGYHFAEDATPDGEQAETITLSFQEGGKTTTMTYNSGTGLYEAAQYGTDKVDGNTGEVVSYKNVITIQAETYYADDGYHQFATLTGSGDGYFACGGRIVPIQWSRDSETDPFTYTLIDGTPVVLGVGHTYVAVTPTGSPVSYQ